MLSKQIKDLTDQEFDRLTVLEFVGKNKHDKAMWLCKCTCGNEKIVCSGNLKSGTSRSCGCLNSEVVAKRNRKYKLLGEDNPFYGKTHSVEMKKKFSEYAKSRVGDKNPRWNSKLTDEERVVGRNYPEYDKWRVDVYKRDDYTCQLCGKKVRNINAHHLNGYDIFPEQRLVVRNGITLCIKCHKDFHKQYGTGSNTKEQWEEFTCMEK